MELSTLASMTPVILHANVVGVHVADDPELRERLQVFDGRAVAIFCRNERGKLYSISLTQERQNRARLTIQRVIE